MRSLSNSFLRSRALWRLLAVAGILAIPTPSQGMTRSIPEIRAVRPSAFSIAQAEAGSDTNPDFSDEATESNPDTTDAPIDLQLGDTDPRIPEIQRLLGIGGYYEGEPSGIFDISTDLAVSRFQESQRLNATGIVDATTWERLQSLDASFRGSESSGSESGEPETNKTPAASTLQEPEDTSSRPEAGSGGFSKLMLWLSLLIVMIGVVGMVFYWLLRLFEGGDQAADTGDFDEFAPETPERSLDPLGGELAQQAAEQQANLDSSADTISTTSSPIAIAGIATDPPIETSPPASKVVDPISDPLPIQNPDIEPIAPTISPVPALSPPIPSPPAIPANPPQPPTVPVSEPPPSPPPEVSVSMASLPLASPVPVAASLSSVTSTADSSLSSEIVTAKVSITERLLQDLHHPEPSQRKKAIWELGRRGDSRAIQPLVNLMLQSDSQQRSLILAVLAEINTRSLEPMQQALALSFQDESPEVRKNALRDLTRIFDSMSQMGYFISNSVNDRDPSVRETAKWAMTQLERIRTSAGVNQFRPDDREPPPS
jgi:peptidoglycan hydrolase-like protein with peptidoglycan-binding domain